MPPHDAWSGADAYDRYMGRWSRQMAGALLAWLDAPPGLRWADVGCGTGALSSAILARADPRAVHGFDLSPQFVAAARARVADPRARFDEGDAAALPAEDGAFQVAASGLMMNFAPDPAAVAREMRRIVAPGGTVAAYLWDYAEGMRFIRVFWDAAAALRPSAAAEDEAVRFPVCRPDPLRALFTDAGLREVEVRALDIATPFRDFDDFWAPFQGGQGPAPGYLAALDDAGRAHLRDEVRRRLPCDPDGAIHLTTRAWAVRGTA